MLYRSSFSLSRCREFGIHRRAITVAVLIGAIAAPGCEKAPPPTTEPAMAPWLYDPKSQIDILTNKDFRLRSAAAFNLGKMGAQAADALPALDKMAKDDPVAKVREKARIAAESIRADMGDDAPK